MAIFTERQKLVPVEYEDCYDAWQKVVYTPWHAEEVQMASDVQDWNSSRLTEAERKAIAGILLGFTLLEQRIGCYWRDLVAKAFPKPEIQFMAAAFSHQEGVHAFAYNHLENTLGLDTFETFLQNEPAQNKVAAYSVDQIENRSALSEEERIRDLLESIAVFSGAGEGLSLFGSFAVLLDFCRRGVLKGTKQILSWSVRDEQLHSDMAISLFNRVAEEYPQYKPSREFVLASLEERVQLEMDFVKNAFDTGGVVTLTLQDIENFLNHRKCKILGKMGYDVSDLPTYESSIEEWFYPLVEQSTEHDFFSSSRNGSAYSATITQDFASVDFKAMLRGVILRKEPPKKDAFERLDFSNLI